MRQRVCALLLGLVGFVALLMGAAPAHAADGASIGGVLKNGETPIAGVTITVSNDKGFSQSTKSDAAGLWKVDLPKAGTYSVLLDTAGLPEGVALSDPTKNPLKINVLGMLPGVATFQFGSGTVTTESLLDRTLQLLANGILFGLVIALAGVGLSLIYGTTGLTNFAHGELITLGALTTFFFNNVLEWDFFLSVALSLITCAILGWAQDKILWKPLRRRGTGLIAMLVVSIGLGVFLRYVFLFLFGGATRQFRTFNGQEGIAIGPVDVTPKALIGGAFAILLLCATAWWLLKTRLGKASRAVADNPALASASGIDVERVINVVWILGATLAAFSGILLAMSQGVSWQLGFAILLLVFAGATLGGFGTAFGALVGSLVVGVIIELSTLVIPPELKNVGALVVLIVILLVRPQGILGRRERVG